MPEEKDLCTHVKNEILNLIESNSLYLGKRMPSEKQLAEKFKVSRSTIRTVLSVLVDEGKIFRRHGSGTYVNKRAFEMRTTLYPQVYFSDLIMRSGYFPEIELLGTRFVEAGEIDFDLGLDPKTKMLEIQKIYTADGKMCIYCDDYIEVSLIHPDCMYRVMTENISIFQVIAMYTNTSVSWDTIKLEATDNLKTPELSQFVKPGETKPFIKMDNITYNSNDDLAFYGSCFIDTDIIKFYLFRGVDSEEVLPEKPK